MVSINFYYAKVDDSLSSDAALNLLAKIANTTPKHVEQLTLPLLFSSLPDAAPPRTADAERNKNWRVLGHLTRLCLQAALFETLVIRLSAKLDLLVAALASTDDAEINVAYIHAILHTLAQVLSKKVERKDPDVSKYVDRLLPHLFRHFIASATASEDGEAVLGDVRLVKVAADIITQVLQTANAQ